MYINRSLLNWGVFLIALGSIPIAVDQGWLESDIASDLGRLWPLILVGIGLGLILRWTPISWFGGALVAATFGVIFGAAVVTIRDDDLVNLQGIIPAIAGGTCAGGETGSASTGEGGPASSESFELSLELSCGELAVARGATTTWSLDADHAPEGAPRIETEELDGVVSGVRLRHDDGDEIAFFGRLEPSRWDVGLPANAVVTVRATLNAAKGTIDTGSGPVARVDATFNASDARIDLAQATTFGQAGMGVTLNASDVELLAPSSGQLRADVTLNASDFSACVPQSMALQVRLSETLSSNDLGDSDLGETSAGTWETPGFTTTADHVTLDISSTVSSLSIARPEACS